MGLRLLRLLVAGEKGKKGMTHWARKAQRKAEKMIAMFDQADFTQQASEPSERQLRAIETLRSKVGEVRYMDLLKSLGDGATPLRRVAASTLIRSMIIMLGGHPGRTTTRASRATAYRQAKNASRRACVRAAMARREELEQAPVPQEAPRMSKPIWAPAVDDQVIYTSPSGEVEAVVTAFKPGFVRLRGPGCSAMWIPVAHVRLSE